MAKTMGAAAVNARLPEAQTDLVAAAAVRHGLLVGIQVADQRILALQLRASPQMRADPDLGDPAQSERQGRHHESNVSNCSTASESFGKCPKAQADREPSPPKRVIIQMTTVG